MINSNVVEISIWTRQSRRSSALRSSAHDVPRHDDHDRADGGRHNAPKCEADGNAAEDPIQNAARHGADGAASQAEFRVVAVQPDILAGDETDDHSNDDPTDES